MTTTEHTDADDVDGADETSDAADARDTDEARGTEKPGTPARAERRQRAADRRGSGGRQVTLSMRAVVLGVVTLLVVATLGIFVYRDVSARNQLGDLRADIDARTTAEKVAGEYAVTAATLNYQDLTPWISNMKKGVSADLQKQYDLIGKTMEQVLTPLRMTTTANLIQAKTLSVSGDVYRVQAVVGVNTTTVQLPNGAPTTAVYAITLDRAQDWLITSVGDPTSAIPKTLGEAPTPAAPEPGQPTQPVTKPGD